MSVGSDNAGPAGVGLYMACAGHRMVRRAAVLFVTRAIGCTMPMRRAASTLAVVTWPINDEGLARNLTGRGADG